VSCDSEWDQATSCAEYRRSESVDGCKADAHAKQDVSDLRQFRRSRDARCKASFYRG
jgi:hypothetical protein